MANQIPPYPLRLTRELRNWLNQKAAENERSLNGEILHRLKESQRREEQEKQKETQD